jgi:tripartite-type tricarboxylate transporter receptor subunit TctC
MPRNPSRLVALALLSSFVALESPHASAQTGDYPTKPITIIVNTPPGATNDYLARLLGKHLGDKWGRPVLVENRAGARGMIAVDSVAKAAPDGYMLLVNSNSLAYQRFFAKDIAFDWNRDLTPIAMLAKGAYGIFISRSVNAQNLAEFVAHAKANPGKLNFGVPGAVIPEFEEMIGRMGIDLARIMYKGGAPVATALLAGEIHMMISGIFQAAPMTSSGKVLVVAYTGAKRHGLIPDVPTMSEVGYPGFERSFWMGLSGPPNLPAGLVQRLNAEARAMSSSRELQEDFAKRGLEPALETPAQMRAAIDASVAAAQRVVKERGIQPE